MPQLDALDRGRNDLIDAVVQLKQGVTGFGTLELLRRRLALGVDGEAHLHTLTVAFGYFLHASR